MRLIDGLGESSQYYWKRDVPTTGVPRVWRHYERDIVRTGERFGTRTPFSLKGVGEMPGSTTSERGGF